MDLAGGRYPQYNPGWVMDGQPSPPYRCSLGGEGLLAISTGNGGTALAATTGKLAVIGVPCEPGDVITTIKLFLGTAAATQTHAWVALYTGVKAASTLIYQSTDEGSSADAAGVLSYSLGSGATTPAGGSYLVGGTGGTPQGAAYTGTPGGQPIVLGVALMWAATTMPKFDGSPGSSGLSFGSQITPVQVVAGPFTATAPATLAGIAASNGCVPYVALTRGN